MPHAPWEPHEHFHHFVVATDFGGMSQRALAHGLALALRVRGRLEIVQVDGTNEFDEIDGLPRVRDLLYRWGKIVDPSDRSDVYGKLGVEIDKRLVSAEAVPPVAQKARPPGAVWMIATDGPDGWLHDWQPTAVEAAIDAGLPVLLIPAEGPSIISLDGRTRVGRVLVALTAAQADLDALVVAQALCRTLGFTPEVRAIAVGACPPEALDAAPAAWSRMVRRGEVATAIADEALGWHADVVVVRRLGAAETDEPLLGPVGDALLGRVECPLLIVP